MSKNLQILHITIPLHGAETIFVIFTVNISNDQKFWTGQFGFKIFPVFSFRLAPNIRFIVFEYKHLLALKLTHAELLKSRYQQRKSFQTNVNYSFYIKTVFVLLFIVIISTNVLGKLIYWIEILNK